MTSVEDLRAKFEKLKFEKEENEQSEQDKAAEAQKSFEDHETVISADPRDPTTNNLTYWWPEDVQFWKRWGWAIAWPNMIWSTINMFLMGAIYIHWIVVVKAVAAAHVGSGGEIYKFGFDTQKNYIKDYGIVAGMIAPLAAFAGATQRGIQCWMTVICGGRVHNVVNTLFICVPMILSSIFLSLSDCPFIAIWLVAIISGTAGGAFSSANNNISYFFPKHQQGLCLGVVAGVAQIGESFAYGVGPLIVDVGICAAGKAGHCDAKDFGGKYPFNMGVFWTILCVVIVVPSWLKLNSAPGHGSEKGVCRSVVQYFQLSAVGWFWGLGFGVLWYYSESTVHESLILLLARIIIFSAACFVLMQGTLYYLTPAQLKEKLRPQMAMIRTRDAWFMCILYGTGFSSLVGWSVVFYQILENDTIFGKMSPPPDSNMFIWIGPFVGGMSRILGGQLADRYGGSTITMWGHIGLTLTKAVVFSLVSVAKEAADPAAMLVPYIIGCVVLFFFAGLASGSVNRQIAFLYPPETRGPALGFVNCFATYFAAVIIIFIMESLREGVHIPIFAMLVVLKIPIIILNWYYYKRAGAVNQC